MTNFVVDDQFKVSNDILVCLPRGTMRFHSLPCLALCLLSPTRHRALPTPRSFPRPRPLWAVVSIYGRPSPAENEFHFQDARCYPDPSCCRSASTTSPPSRAKIG